MVHGLATDDKKYKHKKRNNLKWLCKDLNVYKKTVEKYIDNLRSKDEIEIKSVMMTLDRIIAILFLGIFGSITLITGICLIIKGNYVLGVPLGFIGAVFVVAFCLYEKYR